MNGDTNGTMCSVAGELGIRMRVRGLNGTETKNQHDTASSTSGEKCPARIGQKRTIY